MGHLLFRETRELFSFNIKSLFEEKFVMFLWKNIEKNKPTHTNWRFGKKLINSFQINTATCKKLKTIILDAKKKVTQLFIWQKLVNKIPLKLQQCVKPNAMAKFIFLIILSKHFGLKVLV